MRIFGYELKKIFNWKLMLVLVIFTGLFYNMFLDFYLGKNYLNGHPGSEDYEIGKMLVTKYGTTLDKAELQDFIRTGCQKNRQEINSRILKSKVFQDAKVPRWNNLRTWKQKQIQKMPQMHKTNCI